MTSPNDFKYRLIYEQLARFSSSLSRTQTLDEVRQCLLRHVKYLFDYQLVRLCFYQHEQLIIFSLSRTDAVLQSGGERLRCNYERLLSGNNVPVIIDDAALLAQYVTEVALPTSSGPVQLWHWDLSFGPDSGVIASVFCGEQRLQPTDVTILKLALENLYAKVLSIRLVSELNRSYETVGEAVQKLQKKNDLISKLVASQEAIIRRRTRELELKNAKLLQLSRQHAHAIREPLSRIMSLAYLVEILSTEEIINDIIPNLLTASTDLDGALRQVIHQLDAELPPSKA